MRDINTELKNIRKEEIKIDNMILDEKNLNDGNNTKNKNLREKQLEMDELKIKNQINKHLEIENEKNLIQKNSLQTDEMPTTNIIDMKSFGFTNFFEKQITEKEVNLISARVIEIHREVFKIVSCYGESTARLKGSIFYAEGTAVEYPAIGDFVLIQKNESGDDLIYRVLERKSYFSRANPTLGMGEQIVASNFDYVFLMESLNLDFNLAKLERYLTIAWESGGTPVVVLTKADLCDDVEDRVERARAVASGVEVIAISSVTGEGLEDLKNYVEPYKTIVFLGSSGIGKSTLVNALSGEEIMSTSGIREVDSRGRHTTTHRQLICLPSDVLVIDTPGMREIGIWDAADGLEGTFSDIEEIAKECKFRDCSHVNEPGCAVKKALEKGTLSNARWKSYLKLRREIKYMEQKIKNAKQTMKVKKKGK